MSSPPAKPPRKDLEKKLSALDVAKPWTTSAEHSQAKSAFMLELEVFYKTHCPEKVGGIINVVNNIYKNDETSLVSDLTKKYSLESETSEYIALMSKACAVRDTYQEYVDSRTGASSGAAPIPKPPAPPPPVSMDDSAVSGADKTGTAKDVTAPSPLPPMHAPPLPPAQQEGNLSPVPSSSSGIKASTETPTRPFSGNFRDTRDQFNASAYFTESNTTHVGIGAPPSRTPPRPPGGGMMKSVNESAVSGGEDDNMDGLDADSDQYRGTVHQFDPPSEEPVIREGVLTKLRGKDGEAEKHHFILKKSSLVYVKKKAGHIGVRATNSAQLFLSGLTGYAFGTDTLEDELTRSINLQECLVLPLSKGGRGGAAVGSAGGISKLRASITSTNIVADVEDDEKTFRLFTRQKSFFIRAQSKVDRDAWFSEIDQAAKELQMSTLGKIVTEAEVSPIRVIATSVNDCQICHGSFGLLARRHHCRACGACVCDQCSRDKVRIPSLDPSALFKVCNLCSRELKAARRYGANRSDDL